jgi:radical SAM enzyme (TIGR01210 family)
MTADPIFRAVLDPLRAYGASWEEEPDAAGVLMPTAVVLLTNRQCPFRCIMCDLWVHTLEDTVPAGAIPHQIRAALSALPPARQVKLYNAGSFFDPAAIPPQDDEAIARLVENADRVIVEAHPAFLAGAYAERCLRFRDRINGRLEVAIGLETAHAGVLERLNKRMTIASFEAAAAFLAGHGIDLRVFILLKPPFMTEDEGVEWACRSIDLAMACGATACSIIPTRSGNAPMHALDDRFTPPTLPSLERVIEYGVSVGAGVSRPDRSCRVFADVWDIERFHDCACSPARTARLRTMNLTQRVPAPASCSCGR